MRAAALATILLLAGCAELEPDFSTQQWFDGVEETRPTMQGLHTDSASGLPGLWARSTAQARTGTSSWHFGDGTSYATLANASLETPDFEAGRLSFLRFSYWSDVRPFSPNTATDGAIVEVQVGDGGWEHIDLVGGYPYTLSETAVGSRLSIREGMIAGDDREWHDDYVELTDVEPGTTVRFRFRFSTDIDGSNNMGEGLYIDDVEFLIAE
jgi:hypothetical protein